MPVEFLTDDEAATYGRYVGVPSRAELERVFFLDDEDRALIEHRRGDHMRLGFGLQLVTVRYVGMFLEDPLDVPVVVLDFVAEQLNIADPSCVKRYTERAKTRFDHQWEIRRVCGLTEFAAVEAELRAWVAARSWTSGDGPKAIFTDAVGWLREREVLLPGVSTLVRLVARVRDDTTRRLWGVVEGLLTAGQRSVLDQLLEVPPGSRVSDLERWRKGPPPRGSGPAMIKALDQVAEVMGLGMAGLGADGLVPPRRLAELSRYGMSADASQIRRHPDGRRLATLLATVRFLEGKSVDDTLELMDLLMSTELLNKAQTAANKEKVRKQPQLARASARLAVAVEALFDSDGWGDPAEGARVLAAMEMLPDVLAYRSRLTAPLIPARMIDPAVVTRSWKRLVFGHPAYEGGAVNRHAYTFCVLEQFYRHLKRREIHADASTRWRNPQAQLLEGEPWEAVRGDVLTTLGLLDNPEVLLADHTRTLDAAYREVGGRLAVNTEVRVDDAGKIHLTGVKAVEEPPSLVDLRARTTGMLPRVDLPEVILEVMSWEPQLAAAFTAASGGRSRLEDLEVSIAACLAAHSMNVGYRPIAKMGAPALERSRLSHVFQNYFRPETIGVANAPLVARQAGLRLAQCWGGGLVAAVDGMRFVVPIPAVFARPNRKFFGARRGMTWLNVINDQGIGRGAKVVSGTVRDSLHMVDVIFGLDGGELPEIVVSDTGSYSDLVFGLLELLGISYRPRWPTYPTRRAGGSAPTPTMGR